MITENVDPAEGSETEVALKRAARREGAEKSSDREKIHSRRQEGLVRRAPTALQDERRRNVLEHRLQLAP